MHTRSKPRFLTTSFTAIIATMAMAACTSQADTGADDLTGELAESVPEGTSIVVADQQEQIQTLLSASGLEDDLPYDVEFANFVGGPAILEAFRAGTADVAPVGDVPPIHAQLGDEPVPIILAFETQPTNIHLATAPATDVSTPEDLRGKRIAYAEGTAQQVNVLRALENAGLTPDDVELVRIQLNEFSEALGANEVDVAPLNEPRLTRYLDDFGDDGASTIDQESLGQIAQGLNYVYARGDSLADPAKAAALRHFVETLIEGRSWANENRDEWIEAYYVQNQQVTAEDGRRILDSIGTTGIPAFDEDLVARQQTTIDVLHDAGEIPDALDAEDGFDLRFAPVIDDAVSASGIGRESGDFQ